MEIKFDKKAIQKIINEALNKAKKDIINQVKKQLRQEMNIPKQSNSIWKNRINKNNSDDIG